MYAPVAVSTYARVEHFKRTIEALKKNTLASVSELYIFSDAPRMGDEEKVMHIRRYAHSLDGFKKIHVVERGNNDRIANNRGGMKTLLDQFGRMIFLEEDIVTAPGFLQFMNDALEYYRDHDRILSITGYCPPLSIPRDLKIDCFVLQRFCAWGFGAWRHKFDPFSFALQSHGVDQFFKDRNEIRRFKENGEDMMTMLLREKNGEIDALDVKVMYYEFRKNMFSLYPASSLVQNIGHDGSGIHCGISEKFDVSLWQKKEGFIFQDQIYPDERIIKANKKFRKIGIKGKFMNWIHGG